MEEELRIERARTRRGLCQEFEKCKEKRKELSRQRKELEGRLRLDVKKVKIKRRALKVKKLKLRARRLMKFLRTGWMNFLRTGQMKFLRPVRKKKIRLMADMNIFDNLERQKKMCICKGCKDEFADEI